MNLRKRISILVGFVLSVSLFSLVPFNSTMVSASGEVVSEQSLMKANYDTYLQNQENNGGFDIDFRLGVFDTQLQIAIENFLNKNSASLSTTERNFTVTVQYEDANNVQHIRLFPTTVYNSRWQIPVKENDIISLVAQLDDMNNWLIGFEQLANEEISSQAIPAFSFPWPYGSSWRKTQGYTGHFTNLGYSLDFAPNNGASNSVLAIEAGVLTAYCYTPNDPYQAMVIVTHSDNIKSGYLHLDKSSVPANKFNQSIEKSQQLGNIYTGSAIFNPHTACTDINNYAYATACGCGYAPHLHFETNSLINIQGYSLSEISSSPNGTSYVSNNGQDTTPPTKASNVRPNGWWGLYTNDATPSFAWDSASDNESGMDGYFVAVDDPTPDGGTSGNSYDVRVGNVTTYTFTNELSNGHHIFAVTSIDKAGNRNPTNTNTLGDAPYIEFYVDTLPPTGSFQINNGSTVSYLTQVNIQSVVTDAVSGVKEMRIRNAGDAWGSWQPFSSHTVHLLPSETGQTYTVEVQYKDLVGNISSTYSRSIDLNINPGRPSSTNYTLAKSTLGSSAWSRQSANYTLFGTSGQPSPAGQMNSSNYKISSGYWRMIPVDETTPVVSSITRLGESPTNASSVDFKVIFSEVVTGVSISDFTLSVNGLPNAFVSQVSGSGKTYTVSVNTGAGAGTIRLDVPLTATIKDFADNDISSLPYENGEVYTIIENGLPTNITLSNNSIVENLPSGTTIGTFSTTDPDPADTHIYSLCGGADDASFTIIENTLMSMVVFDFETRDSYAICVRTDDSKGGYFDKTLTISIINEESQKITLTSQGTNDGWILESTETSNKGGKVNSGGSIINIGDDAANKQYRAVLSFDTTLPAGAVVTGATLRFKYAGKTGTLPFSTHGKLLVDVKKGAFSNNPALAKGDFNAGANKNALLSLGKSTGWFTKVFTSTQLSFINTSGVTQFRLRFTKDDNNDFGADLLKIHSGNAEAANRPQLIVEYYVP